MTDAAVVVTLDQGSTGTKAQALGASGRIVGHGFAPVAEYNPRLGWVEQDPMEIWQSVQSAVATALEGHDARWVASFALTNQRESLVLWGRGSAAPVCPMVSWQNRRSDSLTARIAGTGVADRVRRISGLPLDPMFSAVKVSWLLDTHDADRAQTRRGELRLGTVDSWLLSRFGGEPVGDQRQHVLVGPLRVQCHPHREVRPRAGRQRPTSLLGPATLGDHRVHHLRGENLRQQTNRH